MPTIKIYSTPTCPYCVAVKEYLEEKGFKYTDVDVSIDPNAADEMINKTGQMGVPVVDIDGQAVVGFDKEKIDTILGIK